MSAYTTTKRCWYCDDQPGEQCDACDDRRPLINEINLLRHKIAGLELRISQSNSSVKIFKPPYRSRGNQ